MIDPNNDRLDVPALVPDVPRAQTEVLSRREGPTSMDAVTNQELNLEPPGPGPWDLDALHLVAPARTR